MLTSLIKHNALPLRHATNPKFGGRTTHGPAGSWQHPSQKLLLDLGKTKAWGEREKTGNESNGKRQNLLRMCINATVVTITWSQMNE